MPPRPAGAPSPYRCPVPGAAVSAFDAPATRYSTGHRGVDLPSTVGAPVVSPASGTVSFAGMVAGRPVITIDHGGGWRTSVEPVAAVLRAGALVRAGAVVGRVDAAPGHCAPRTCVHLGVRRGEEYVDPYALLQARPVVLLPMG